MRPLIVYQSRTGNTHIIADIIASTLDADILPVENVVPGDFKGRTLVGFGSGIYWAMIDRKIYEAATFLPEKCSTFVFITSGMGIGFMRRLYWHFIKEGFDRLNLKPVGNWDCRGFDKHPTTKWMGISKGRPNRADIESAEQFAAKMYGYASHPFGLRLSRK